MTVPELVSTQDVITSSLTPSPTISDLIESGSIVDDRSSVEADSQHNISTGSGSHDDGRGEGFTAQTISSVEQSFSPPPLLWTQGWNTGHFSFNVDERSDGDNVRSEGRGVMNATSDSIQEASETESGAVSNRSEGQTSEGNRGEIGRQSSDEIENANIISSSTSTKSTLVPTAAPFIFAPRSQSPPPLPSPPAVTPHFTTVPPPLPRLPFRSNSNSNVPRSSTFARNLSYGDPVSPNRVDQYGPGEGLQDQRADLLNGGAGRATRWSFDAQGLLIGAAPRYRIVDESGLNSPTLGGGGGGMVGVGRRESLGSPFQADDVHWHQQQHPHSPTARFGGVLPLMHPDRPRSSSIASSGGSSYQGTFTGSYFTTPQPTSTLVNRAHHRSASSFDRAAAAAQLSSYFGPSSVQVSPQAFDLPLHEVSYAADPLSIGLALGGSSPQYSQYQTDPDDLLYTQARQTFVQQSLLTLANTNRAFQFPTSDIQYEESRTAMMSHFDRAMHSMNPLATLFGLSDEAARALAADPESSGVSESVLRLASMRSQAQRNSMGIAGLAGPSANNRKLGLYKTELCRNWEEKGSCRYGSRCQYAHGTHETRDVSRHPKFKTEVCRTFWQSGSCGYGKRCCFIHTTVPGGAQSAPPPDSLAAAMNGNISDNIPEPVSRLSQRMSSTPIRGFGPAVADYLGPIANPSINHNGSSVPTHSHDSSPASFDRYAPDLSANRENGRNGLFGIPFDQGSVGLGLKGLDLNGASLVLRAGGSNRFTSNPTEVPAQYQEPPLSRLQRLSSQQRIDPLLSNASSPGSVQFSPLPSSSSNTMMPTSTPLSRHASNGSYSTISSSSSASSIAAQGSLYSPFLSRVDSSGSISSVAGSAYNTNAIGSRSNKSTDNSTLFPLQLAGNDWLGAGVGNGSTPFASSSTLKTSAFDWSGEDHHEEGEEEERLEQQQQQQSPSHLHQLRSFANARQGRETAGKFTIEGLGIDRSSERTPLGQRFSTPTFS